MDIFTSNKCKFNKNFINNLEHNKKYKKYKKYIIYFLYYIYIDNE